jgi:hypothetical protein
VLLNRLFSKKQSLHGSAFANSLPTDGQFTNFSEELAISPFGNNVEFKLQLYILYLIGKGKKGKVFPSTGLGGP